MSPVAFPRQERRHRAVASRSRRGHRSVELSARELLPAGVRGAAVRQTAWCSKPSELSSAHGRVVLEGAGRSAAARSARGGAGRAARPASSWCAPESTPSPSPARPRPAARCREGPCAEQLIPVSLELRRQRRRPSVLEDCNFEPHHRRRHVLGARETRASRAEPSSACSSKDAIRRSLHRRASPRPPAACASPPRRARLTVGPPLERAPSSRSSRRT